MRLLGLALIMLVGAVVAGCGDGARDRAATQAAPPAEPAPSARPEDFPSAEGRSLPDVVGVLPGGPTLAPSMSVLGKGRNRVGFALLDTASKQLTGASVALYVGEPDGSRARGPYVARSETLAVRPQFRSRQTAEDQDAARSVYVAEVPFARHGEVAMVAVAKLDGRLIATKLRAMRVGRRGARVPDVGERAPVIHTDTRADVAGDLTKIDTRRPPLPEMHEVDAADVLGREPVVLVFATPQLCASRVCGPVVDVAAEVQAELGDRVHVVHQEIYNDNDRARGFRPQVKAYRLPSEPWTFVVDRGGRVAARFEGALSVGELRRAVQRVAG
jgi:hypothetical protein